MFHYFDSVASPEEEVYLSVDDFLYSGCAVVANGRSFYQNVLNNRSEMPEDLTFEPLLYIALHAYKRKTGNIFTKYALLSKH